MTNSTAIILLISIAAAVLLPGLVWMSRFPRMDREGDDLGVRDDPLLQWPPTPAERAQVRRITRLLVVMGLVLVMLAVALYLAWRAG